MSGPWDDPPLSPDAELDELFQADPELRRIAQLVRESRPEPVLDPRFPALLRARLMREAATALAPRRTRFHRRGMRVAAWGTFSAGVALAAAALIVLFAHPSAPVHSPALAVQYSNVSHQLSVDPHQAITVRFNQPMDERNQVTVVDQVTIHPATAFSVSWQNRSTLVVTPVHPLAANTDYQLVIPRSAVRSQSGKTLNTDVTITFGTQPTATPSPSASPLPTLQPAVVGDAGPGAEAFWESTGIPGVTASTDGQPSPAATPTPAATSSASPNAAATPSPGPGGTSTESPRPTASPSPSAPTSTGDASPSPVASGTGTASPSSPTPAPTEGAAVFPQGAPAIALSHAAATAVALSPDGFYIALALAQPEGGSRIVVETAQSADPASTAYQVWPAGSAQEAPVTWLAWASGSQLVFVTPQGIEVANLERVASVVYPFASGGSADGVVLAPDGRHAFVPAGDANPAAPGASQLPSPPPSVTATPSPAASPSASPAQQPAPDDGWLVSLPVAGQAGAAIQLPGSAEGLAAFSGDGQTVAWTESNTDGQAPTVVKAQVSTPGTATPVPGLTVAGITQLALNQDGSDLAYNLDPGGATLVSGHDGTVIGSSSVEATSLAFSPDGSEIAYVAGNALEVAALGPSSQTKPPSPCEGADAALSLFVDAQVAGDAAELSGLTVPGLGADALTPSGLSRGYVISAGCGALEATGSPLLTASARLVVDPTGTAPGQLTDETVILQEQDGGWVVTGLRVPPLHPQGSGPAVISVAATPPEAGSQSPESVVTVVFDADLDGSTVNAATLWVEDAQGRVIPALSAPSYDPNTREATVTVAGDLPVGAQVLVGTSITDIDGGHPSAAAAYPVGG